MSEMKDLTAQVKQAMNDATEGVRELKQKQTEELSAMRKELDDMAARVFRPGFGAPAMEGKTMTSDPELTAFIAKGTMPTTEKKELSVTNDGQGVTVRGE